LPEPPTPVFELPAGDTASAPAPPDPGTPTRDPGWLDITTAVFVVAVPPAPLDWAAAELVSKLPANPVPDSPWPLAGAFRGLTLEGASRTFDASVST